MLAAVRPADREDLNLFCVALSMVASGDTNLPQSLKEYVVRVFNEAKDVASDLNKADTASPESISLAVDMAQEEDLLEAAKTVDTFEKISPEIAAKFLTRVEGFDARN